MTSQEWTAYWQSTDQIQEIGVTAGSIDEAIEWAKGRAPAGLSYCIGVIKRGLPLPNLPDRSPQWKHRKDTTNGIHID